VILILDVGNSPTLIQEIHGNLKALVAPSRVADPGDQRQDTSSEKAPPQLRQRTELTDFGHKNGIFLGSIWRSKSESTCGEPQNSWDLWMFIPLKLTIFDNHGL